MFSALTSLEKYLIAGVAVVIAVFAYSWHERSIGEAKVEAKYETALRDAAKKTADQTATLKQQATDAAKAAQDVQTQLNDYQRAHPIGVVRLCKPTGSSAVVSAAPTAGGTQGDGAGPVTIPEVPTGGPEQGADIGPELGTIVQSAQRLAVIDAERQRIDADYAKSLSK